MKNTIKNPFTLFFYVKRTMIVLLLVFSVVVGYSQETQETQETQKASVEKSVFGIQFGVLGLWAHHELKISNQVALRSEIGIEVGLWLNDTGSKNFQTSLPSLALEPRWYYNLNKRANQDKRIDGNSGNYISLRATYYFYDYSDTDKHNINQPWLVPTWGIRRNIGNHFNYEAGAGIGLGFGYDNERRLTLTPYVNLKIGYRF
jgi:hypothetical protein